MSHKNKLEAAMSTATEARLATIGRQIAENIMRGEPVTQLIREAAQLRSQEQQNADQLTRFAALVRQIGDAYNAGRPYQGEIATLVELRRAEVGSGTYGPQVERMNRAR